MSRFKRGPVATKKNRPASMPAAAAAGTARPAEDSDFHKGTRRLKKGRKWAPGQAGMIIETGGKP